MSKLQKTSKILSALIIISMFFCLIQMPTMVYAVVADYEVNLTNLTVKENGTENSIKNEVNPKS